MLEEISEQQELLRCQLYLMSGCRDHVSFGIDLQIPERERGRCRRCGGAPAEHGTDTGDDLAGTERLRDVIVGAEIEAGHAVSLFGSRRDHDDRNRLGPWVGPHRTADVPAVHSRQHDIQQDQIGRALAHPRQHAGSREHHRSLEARFPDTVRQQVRNVLVIFHDEHPPRSGNRRFIR